MAPHSSTLAWKIPWTQEPGRLQSTGLLRVRHAWATSVSLSLSCIGEGNGNPLQCSCLENPRDGGAWWAAVYGVAQSQTRLRWLSSSNWWYVPILISSEFVSRIFCSFLWRDLTYILLDFSIDIWCFLLFWMVSFSNHFLQEYRREIDFFASYCSLACWTLFLHSWGSL